MGGNPYIDEEGEVRELDEAFFRESKRGRSVTGRTPNIAKALLFIGLYLVCVALVVRASSGDWYLIIPMLLIGPLIGLSVVIAKHVVGGEGGDARLDRDD